MLFIGLFLLGCVCLVTLHELTHVAIAQAFGGRVLSVRILGLTVYPGLGNFTWTGDVAHAELGFDTDPGWLGSWLVSCVPEILNLLLAILVPVILLSGRAGSPPLLAFLIGVFATSLFGLLGVVMSVV